MLLRLDFSFFAVMALFFLTESGFGFMALASCAAHELSHLAVMGICGIRAEHITFYGAGICISSAGTERAGLQQQIAVFSAGCAVNLALAAALYLTGEYAFSAVNLLTGAFNLLPLGEFDGARLLRLLAIRKAPPERVDGIMRAAGALSAVLCAVFLLSFGGEVSVTLFTTAVYLIVIAALGC